MNSNQKAIKEKFKEWDNSNFVSYAINAAGHIYGIQYIALIFDPDEMNHIANCMQSMVDTLTGEKPGGDFIKCLLRKDFYEAIKRADSTNIKAIQIYASFMYNELPWNCEEILNPEEKES